MIDTSPTPWIFDEDDFAIRDANGDQIIYLDFDYEDDESCAAIHRAFHAVNHHAALREALSHALDLLRIYDSLGNYESIAKALAKSAEAKP